MDSRGVGQGPYNGSYKPQIYTVGFSDSSYRGA